MTTTQQIGISVLCAPLAAIDRRSLSQAWYSALHLARDGSPPRCTTARRGPENPTPASAPASAGSSSHRAAASAPAILKPSRRAPVRAGATLERRAPRMPLARRIERALFERAPSAARTTFAVGKGGGRVVVVLHFTGERIRLVALCSPTLRRTVASALDQARFALADRGIALDTGVLEGAATCS
jgi:hypothetical protein